MSPRQSARLIEKVARELGGERKLCIVLGVSWPDLQSWLDARSSVPTAVFLKLLDLLENIPAVADASDAAEHRLLHATYAPACREELLDCALDAALAASGTDLGNVQVLDETGTLRIAAQRGFGPEFLDFFAAVKAPESACGVALILGRQYCIADVETHPIFRGTPAGAVVHGSGVRSVESTPIIGASARPLGMLSVHHRTPGTPEESVTELLVRIARRTGALLEAQAKR